MPERKSGPIPSRLARVIAELRRKKGWSQNELSRRAGLSPAAVSRLLRGERKARLEHLLALAAALEVTLEQLVAHTEVEPLLTRWGLGADNGMSVESDRDTSALGLADAGGEIQDLREKLRQQAADHAQRVAQLQRGRDRALAMANKYYVAWETLRTGIAQIREQAVQNRNRTIDIETLAALHDNSDV